MQSVRNAELQPAYCGRPVRQLDSKTRCASYHIFDLKVVMMVATISEMVVTYVTPFLLSYKGFTSHSTQNRSFRRRSSQPVSGLSIEKLNLKQHKQITQEHNGMVLV